jgi:hypothetical protein
MNNKKTNKNEMFFITAFEKLPDKNLNTGNSRCFGFYPEYDMAVEALHKNRCDIYEYCYSYAVIEKIGQGIHQVCLNEDRQFFKWNEIKEGFYEINEPEEVINLLNFSLG